MKEEGCAVIEAVTEGKIASSRHASYVLMYEEIKQIREWNGHETLCDFCLRPGIGSEQLIPLLREEDYIVAADGGFPAERMNRTPDLVVADFDSGSRESAERTGAELHILPRERIGRIPRRRRWSPLIAAIGSFCCWDVPADV